MVIYGIHSVEEALQSEASRIERILVTRGKGGQRLQQLVDLARARSVPLHFEPLEALDRKAGTGHHQNVVAELSPLAYQTLKDIVEARPRLLLLVDGVEDPRNLGAVIRTAEAAGVEALLLPQRHSCGVTPTVVKVSAGAALHLSICRIGNVVQTLEQLKEAGLWAVGLDMDGDHHPHQLDPDLPLVVVVGSENRGLRPLVRKHCDFLVQLPMCGRVSSLNLSVAAGILLYDIVFRRGLLPEEESTSGRLRRGPMSEKTSG